jgi:GMP synthase-like glutamine amidotransferase
VRTLVLQHVACEPPGAYEDVMIEHGALITRVELDEGERPPPGERFDVIVAMGGPMGAYEDAAHPWLREEKALIEREVRSGTPFFGVCLGVQLLAAALGARVFPGPAPEVGVMNVELTSDALADPVFAGLPQVLPTLQWHGDTFDLPAGAVRLAGSAAYPNQAFRFERAYGVQFHLEVSDAMAAEWGAIPAYAESADRVLGPGSLPDLLGELAGAGAGMRDHACELFGRFLEHVVLPSR